MPRLLDDRFTRSLADVPTEYTGANGFLVAVNGTGTGLVFLDPTAVASGGIGSIMARLAYITESTGTVFIGNPIIGLTVRVRLIVTAPFSPDTVITIGTQASPTLFTTGDTIDWTRVGTSEVDADDNFPTGTQMVASITRGVTSPGTGTGIVIVEFVQGGA